MKSKNLVTIVLLLFVAASIVVLAVKSLRRNPQAVASSNTTDGGPPTAAQVDLPTDGVVAYYFHGTTRCPTCQTIESYAHEAIQLGFADQIKDGTIRWQVLNYEAPENARFAKEFEIVAPTLVLVRMKNGKQVKWENLMKVWELVDDRPAFVEFVQKKLEDLMQS